MDAHDETTELRCDEGCQEVVAPTDRSPVPAVKQLQVLALSGGTNVAMKKAASSAKKAAPAKKVAKKAPAKKATAKKAPAKKKA